MPKIRHRYRDSKTAITLSGLILVVLLGVIDYATGPVISFSIFYVLPISLLTWFAGERVGMIAAVMSAIAWLFADLATQATYTHPLVPFWNALVRFLVFAVIVYLESALKRLNQDLEGKVADRTALLTAEVAERMRVEERLQQSARRLAILHDIDRAILAAQSLETIAVTTLFHIRNSQFCDQASMLLFDYDAQKATMYTSNGDESASMARQRSFPIDAEVNSLLESLHCDAVQLLDDTLDRSLPPSVSHILQVQGYRSVLVVPICAHDELIGSLTLVAGRPHAFSPEHVEMGRELVNQLGIAFTQATIIDQLRASQENLQTLSKRLLSIQEAERRKIARELHDEVGQALTGIGLMLDAAAHADTNETSAQLEYARTLVIDLMDRVSRLSLELRPTLLDDLGLIPTLVWHTNRYSSQTNIQVNLKHSGLENRRFIPEIETAAYRIVQEALTNVARYAQVNQASVTLWCDQNVLGIQVEDEGAGFDPESALAAGCSGGLIGMQERALLLNGTLTIESASGQGTRVLAEIPVDELAVQERG